MNTVIYARYSAGPRQTDQSIEGQLRVCTDFCKQRGLTVIDTYCDRHISGRTDERPEFQRLIADAKRKKFEAVVVYKTDRFARNKYDSAVYKRELKRNGIQIFYAAEAIPDGPEGIILESLMEGLAEYYSAELAQKIKRGMHESALKCQSTGSGRPLGYRVDEQKRFQIDPESAQTVQTIFEQYIKGESNAAICELLNSRGLRTAQGKPFNKNSINRIIKNRKYIGEYRYHDIVVEGGMPAIIPKDTFNLAQAEMERRRTRKAPKSPKAEYLLAGRLFCGHCKGPMQGVSGTGKSGNKWYYYYCGNTRGKNKTCDKKQVSRDRLERAVVDFTVRYILQEEVLEELARKVHAAQERQNDTASEIAFYEKKLADNKKSIANVLRAIESGAATQTLPARLQELENEQAVILGEISFLKGKRLAFTEDQILFALMKHLEPYPGESEQDYRRRIISDFVSEVYLYDDRLLIYFNISSEDGKLKSADLSNIEGGEFDEGLASSTKNKAICLWQMALFLGFARAARVTLLYSMACRKSSQALSTALPMCCMVRPTQVFMDLCRGETAMPTAAPSTMPAPIPHQNAVFSISLTLLFAQRQYAPCAAKKSEIALLKSAIAVIIFLKSDKKRGSLMTTIYLIRHAEADGNLYRRAHGWYDSVITDRGYRQIAALAKRFASTRFDAVYSSDRRRTMTTALSVYKTHGLPLVTTPRVREIGIGVWEDHPWAELERTDGEQLERFNTDAAHWHVAGGEHLPDVRERMIGALREIAEAHPNGTVAVFSHGMAIRLTVGTLQGLSLHEIDGTGHAENTAVSCLEYEDGAFRVAYRDDASHLENGLQTLKRQAWLKNARGFEGGIYYVPSGAEGHFDVCRAGETVGAVSVDKCENGLAVIGEFWLENDVQGLGFGQQLVGQALSYARAHGCERLSTGRIAKSNALSLRRAREWGFTQTGEGADWLEFQKNFEYDEESCWKKLQEVIEKEK